MSCNWHCERLVSHVTVDKLRKYLRPAESIIAPLYRDRDTLPDGKLLYSLVLSYNFKVQANSSVTPNFPCVMNQLYEHFLAGVFGIGRLQTSIEDFEELK